MCDFSTHISLIKSSPPHYNCPDRILEGLRGGEVVILLIVYYLLVNILRLLRLYLGGRTCHVNREEKRVSTLLERF